jgi:hypothetical protein
MRNAVRLTSALGLLTVLLAIQPAVGRADCPQTGTNQICYDRPAVDKAVTDTGYTFPAGSHVTIQANGCEQTGGSGDTWKRYVNPDPPNGSSFYGLAGIYPTTHGGPTTLGLTRISSIQGHVYRPTTQSYLQVGFKDDDYDDNGYDSHDDGDNGQCAPGGSWGYGGPAYILLTITPNAAPSVTATQPAAYVSGLTTFTGSGSDADGDTPTYHFLVDGGEVSGALTGTSFAWDSTSVSDGQHSVALEGSDPYTSATSTARTFHVDNTSPTVAITNGPSNQTFGPGSTETWTFAAGDGAGSGIQGVLCRVDNAPVTCRSASSHSVSNLSNGPHTFSVQATDKVGHSSNVDSRTFAIDATPPETTITSGPTEGASTTDASVSFAFASSEPGSTFECRLSPIKPDFAPCASADLQTGLAPGAYAFEVRAADAFANLDATPAVRHFRIAEKPAGTPPSQQPAPPPAGGGGGNTVPAGTTPTTALSKLKLPATIRYAYRSALKLTKLQVRHVPRGSTLRVTCKGRGCPKALKHAYVKRHVHGTVSLSRFIKHRFRAGVKLTFRISNPGWRTTVKTLRFRAGRAPLVN